MTTIEIQYEAYVRPVRANAQSAAVLAARLKKAAPTGLTAEQRKALRQVGQAAIEVQEVQSKRDRVASGKLRPLLDAFTNDWSALYETLTATARLSEDVSPHGPRAATIVASLFPDAVSFTKLAADRAWAEGDRRLARLAAAEFGRDVEAIAGKAFLLAVNKSTTKLADAIGTGRGGQPVASTTALAEALAKFGRAVQKYGRLLTATVDEDDDASVKRFLAAVAPIDAHRVAIGRSGGGADPIAPEPTEPTEPAEPEPTDPDEPVDPEPDDPDDPVDPTPVVGPTPSPGPFVED